MNIAEGQAHLEHLLAETAADVAPGVTVGPTEVIGPSECTDRLNRGKGTMSTTVGIDLKLEPGAKPEELLGPIESYWRRKGYTVDRRKLTRPQPELLGQDGGFTFRALAVAASSSINLAGDTPCLPPAPREDPPGA